MRRQLVCVSAVLTAALTGCGIGATGPAPAGPPASGLRRPGSTDYYAQLYFVSPFGVQAVARRVNSPAGPQQALDLLLAGPDTAERARGLITEVPAMPGRPTATAESGAVDLYLPVPVAKMNGGGLGVTQLVCTAANAEVPGGKQPPAVDVRVHEAGTPGIWTVRCNAAGNVLPVPNPTRGGA
uniref:Lipoprotein n=1 Tax=Streptomyces sp. NBC_00003 TaxID=2903608 RepID=A0AAU2UX56_9ACTN